jgi:hypothetical protein
LTGLEQVFDTRGVSPSPTRAEAAALAELDPRVRPLTLAAERTLPVLPALGALLPAGLPRGATLAVSGSAGRSFAVALLAAASRAGSWVAVVGVPGFGWRAAAEVGLDLARVVVVDPVPPAVVPECLGALVDGFDAVLLGAEARVPGASARRLAARARERGTVLVAVVEPWFPGGTRERAAQGPLVDVADLRALVEGKGWEGLGSGFGRLGGRQVAVELEGRRLPGRRRRSRLWLPGPEGAVAPVEAPHLEVLGRLAPTPPVRSTA